MNYTTIQAIKDSITRSEHNITNYSIKIDAHEDNKRYREGEIRKYKGYIDKAKKDIIDLTKDLKEITESENIR